MLSMGRKDLMQWISRQTIRRHPTISMRLTTMAHYFCAFWRMWISRLVKKASFWGAVPKTSRS